MKIDGLENGVGSLGAKGLLSGACEVCKTFPPRLLLSNRNKIWASLTFHIEILPWNSIPGSCMAVVKVVAGCDGISSNPQPLGQPLAMLFPPQKKGVETMGSFIWLGWISNHDENFSI